VIFACAKYYLPLDLFLAPVILPAIIFKAFNIVRRSPLVKSEG
jgi:hypothetical protein